MLNTVQILTPNLTGQALLSVESQWCPDAERAAILNGFTVTGNIASFSPHQLQTIPQCDLWGFVLLGCKWLLSCP